MANTYLSTHQFCGLHWEVCTSKSTTVVRTFMKNRKSYDGRVFKVTTRSDRLHLEVGGWPLHQHGTGRRRRICRSCCRQARSSPLPSILLFCWTWLNRSLTLVFAVVAFKSFLPLLCSTAYTYLHLIVQSPRFYHLLLASETARGRCTCQSDEHDRTDNRHKNKQTNHLHKPLAALRHNTAPHIISTISVPQDHQHLEDHYS